MFKCLNFFSVSCSALKWNVQPKYVMIILTPVLQVLKIKLHGYWMEFILLYNYINTNLFIYFY